MPFGGQPSHACLPGPRFVFSCPCPSGEVKRPGSHPPGGRAQGPAESGFPCSIIFLWVPFEGENVRNALREKVGARGVGPVCMFVLLG